MAGEFSPSGEPIVPDPTDEGVQLPGAASLSPHFSPDPEAQHLGEAPAHGNGPLDEFDEGLAKLMRVAEQELEVDSAPHPGQDTNLTARSRFATPSGDVPDNRVGDRRSVPRARAYNPRNEAGLGRLGISPRPNHSPGGAWIPRPNRRDRFGDGNGTTI